jgi:tyrosyl-tRNA synthetase
LVKKGDFEANKMSKSKPDSAIWVHDSLEEIERKLKKAYCPMVDSNLTLEENKKIQEFNPMLDWAKKMIFKANKVVAVERPEKFGGDKIYTNFIDLQKDYFEGSLHPLDLKNAIAKTLADWFLPVREYILKNPAGLEILKNLKK